MINTVAPILKPIKTAEGPWQMVGVDLIGPYKRKPIRQQVHPHFNRLMVQIHRGISIAFKIC